MAITPYLFLDNRAEEAIAFYKAAIGAETTMLMRYRDSPEPPPGGLQPGQEDRIMHAEISIGGDMVMLSDGHCGAPGQFAGFSLYLPARDAAHAGTLFAALSDGGEVRMPLAATFWSPAFGMVQDRFGVTWMVGAVGPQQP